MAMRRPTWIEMLVIVGIIALLISIILPTLERKRQIEAAERCPRHLRIIGQALLLYANDYGGVYPPTLPVLATSEDITKEIISCPMTRKPFVFLSPGSVAKSLGEEDLVVYEPPEYNDGEGSNMLFGDGHVSWQPAAVVQQYIARAATRPSTRPAN
jgi:prepilin-type processing-associated H-X9-DG protein